VSPVEIRAGTILPAQREVLTLHTADGLSLVGEIAVPVDGEPAATLICLHPLPTHGGSMDSHVLRKAAWRLPALAGIAVLRLNTRGTSSREGTSQGCFDAAGDERYDVAAAIEYAEFNDLPNRWLLGWSFGTDLALMYGLDPAVNGAVLLSPPLRYTRPEHLDARAADRRPLRAVVPELDDFLRPGRARERFARVPQAEVVAVDGARHLWVGEPSVRRVLDEVVAAAVPDAVPLPTEWAGPFETYDELGTPIQSQP